MEQASDKLILEASLDDMYDWSALETMIVEEKLRHLLNLSELFDQLSDSKFTYSFTPDNLVFNRNAEPQLIFGESRIRFLLTSRLSVRSL